MHEMTPKFFRDSLRFPRRNVDTHAVQINDCDEAKLKHLEYETVRLPFMMSGKREEEEDGDEKSSKDDCSL